MSAGNCLRFATCKQLHDDSWSARMFLNFLYGEQHHIKRSGDLNSEQFTKVKLARTRDRCIQKPSLEQKVPCVLLGISNTMNIVV